MYLERVQAREERREAANADEETGRRGKATAAAAAGPTAASEKKTVFHVFEKQANAGESLRNLLPCKLLVQPLNVIPHSMRKGYVPPYSANSKYYTLAEQDRPEGTYARNPVLSHLDEAMMAHGPAAAGSIALTAAHGTSGTDVTSLPARIDNPYRQQGSM